MAAPVVWFEIAGRDLDVLTRFYGELLGWKVDADNPQHYGMVDTGAEGGIPGGIYAPGDPVGEYVSFYAGVQGLEGYLERPQRPNPGGRRRDRGACPARSDPGSQATIAGCQARSAGQPSSSAAGGRSGDRSPVTSIMVIRSRRNTRTASRSRHQPTRYQSRSAPTKPSGSTRRALVGWPCLSR